MTTPSTARKAGPFTGNGSQTSWPFTFKVFAAGDIKVTIANTAGAESVLTLNSDYTVTLNSNQESSPGGSVSYTLPNNYKLTIIGGIEYEQGYDIPSGGNFNPVALENQLDRMVMQTQQLAEQVVRAVKVPVTEEGDGELSGALAQGILALGPVADDITTVAGSIDEVEAVADNAADVSAVGANIANVNTVASIASNVTAVAGNASNINAVAGNATNINTVAAVADDVTTVAGVAPDVAAVADVASDIPTIAENLADITNFADVYQGPKSSDPTLRNDGTALQSGDLYFNTATNAVRVYGSTGWSDAGTPIPVTITAQVFNGDGTETEFTLSVTPAFPAAVDVYISGVHQTLTTDYTVTGTTLTFTVAPPSGTGNIQVKILSPYAAGVPTNGSVTTAKLGSDVLATLASKANTTDVNTALASKANTNHTHAISDVTGLLAALDGKLSSSNGAVTSEKIADGAVTNAKIDTVDAAKLTGDVAAARLGSGTTNNTTFLRGDRTWQPIPVSATTANVLSAIAGASFGAAGTYAFLSRIGATTDTFVQGSTYAGSTLAAAGFLRDNSGDVSADSSSAINGTRNVFGVSGTWRCMGRVGSTNDRDLKMTLFLRIS